MITIVSFSMDNLGVTTVPHLVPRFRVSGAKSLLPPCVFKAYTRTTSTFTGIGRLGVDLNYVLLPKKEL
jgi:hypothetical protein